MCDAGISSGRSFTTAGSALGATGEGADATAILNGLKTAGSGVVLPYDTYATDSRASLATTSAAGLGIQLSLAAGEGSGAAIRSSVSLRRSSYLRGAGLRYSLSRGGSIASIFLP
jgi:hypothetical protein